MATGTIHNDHAETVTVTAVGQSAININAAKRGGFVFVNAVNAIYPGTINTDTKIAALSVRPNAQTFGVGKTIGGADIFAFVNTSGELFISGLTPVGANTNMYFSLIYQTLE